MNRKFMINFVIGFACLPFVAANAGNNEEKIIMQAESAAPDSISKNATIIGRDGKVLREGSNGWTCMANGATPMCNDAVWMKLLKALGEKSDFKTDRIGISYMLQGDSKGDGVSNSDPYHSDPRNADDYIETGPHLMIVVPKEQLEGISDDPSQGGPWVMWKDTPYAHIMVPIDELE